MYAVILAGGSGTRLWPLSRELFPKQYLSLPFAGPEESLFQATVERATAALSPDKLIVVTHRDQAGEVRRRFSPQQLEQVTLLEEPQARNTAPAIGLAAWFLNKTAGPDTEMAVLPSDHLVPDSVGFTALLQNGAAAAAAYGLVTFGIRPTYPETGYGYICCGEELAYPACRVKKFVEKPDMATAKAYLADSRYLWNSGMFVFNVGKLIEQYRKLLPEMAADLDRINYENFSNLGQVYSCLESISIDYGILERSDSVTVIPAEISWSDVGSWEACYQVSPKDQAGNCLQGRVIAESTANSLIIGSSRLIGAVGLNDLIVVDTPDALLVCDRSSSQDVKKIVGRLQKDQAPEIRQHLTIYRPWGSYTTLEMGETYQVKRIEVNPGSRLSLQSHRHRAEHWVVVEGEALVTVDDKLVAVSKGENIFIPRGARHRMENKGEGPLTFIEVQNGNYLGEDDIVRYEDDYGRTAGAAKTHPPGAAAEPAAAETGSAAERFERWLNHPGLEPAMREELLAMQGDSGAIENHFGRELVFGTGGMRGIIGPGLNRINRYVIRRTTQGLANYITKLPAPAGQHKIAIAHDTRLYSAEFAEAAALVLAANGIKALLFEGVRPTPLLSFATRELGCSAGIVITASHNPLQYNGYKVYGPDGGQAVSPLVDNLISAIEKVDIFNGVQTILAGEAEKSGMVETVKAEFDRLYLDRVRALSLSSPAESIRVVFTPLHGAGAQLIPQILNEAGYVELFPVEEQMVPDPQFSTVKVPNPEDPAALKMALAKAAQVKADLVLATDPDGDRVGTAVPAPDGSYKIISGNQVGALLIEYICSRLQAKGAMPPQPAMIKTIVTGDLGRRVAESYGLSIVETLTGFKFIGDKMKEFEATGKYNFVFGYEESYGYLTGTFVRDKDAVIASLMIAEMAAYYKEQGKTLLQGLDDIHSRYGYHSEDLFTVELEDISEADRHVAAFRELPPLFAGVALAEKRDYEQQLGWNLKTGEAFNIDLPKSQVFRYTLADGSWFAVRPSGTEPKVKFYLSTSAPTRQEAELKLDRLRKAVQKRA